MGKVIKSIGGLLLLFLIGGAIVIFLLWSRIPDAIASHLSKRLQVGVEIGDINLSFKGIAIDHFSIHNPRGYILPKALYTRQITIHAPLTHFFHNDIDIDEIIVNDVQIDLEFDSIKSTKGNWSTILANAQSAQNESSKSSSEKSVFIRRLLLTNIQANLYYQSEGKTRKLKPIQQIELFNISSKGGDFGDQLMNSALGEAVKQIFIEENMKDVLDQLLQSPTSPLKDYLGPLKNLFN